MTEEYLTYGHRLEQHIADTAALAWRALDDGKLVLFEGAQGALLDIDHGTYPFVTSSNPVAGAACVGAGVGPQGHRRGLGHHQGLRDARRRRPVPDRAARRDRRADPRQAAASSARRPAAPRRTGWLDLVALRYAARLNSLTALAVTKLDVLSGFDTIKVCTSYRGSRDADFHRDVPLPPVGAAPRARRVRGAARAGPRTSPSAAREADLPQAARDYLAFIEERRRRADRADRRRPRPRAGHLDASAARAAPETACAADSPDRGRLGADDRASAPGSRAARGSRRPTAARASRAGSRARR